MNEVKVSVIIPTHNLEPYIEACLDSVLVQSLKDIEIIVVDDGSGDNTLEILRRMASCEDRLKVVAQDNAGVSVARNRGAEMARGKYLYFFDGDDVLHPRALEILFSRAEEKDFDLIRFHAGEFYHGERFDFSDIAAEEVVCREISKKDYLSNMEDYVVMIWQYFIRRDLWEGLSYGFLEGYVHEDCELTPRLIVTSKKMGRMSGKLHLQRIRYGSVSRSDVSRHSADSAQVVVKSLHEFVERLEDCEYFPGLYRLTANEILVAVSSSLRMGGAYRKEVKRRMNPYLGDLRKSDRGLHRLFYFGFRWSYWLTAYVVYLRHRRLYGSRKSQLRHRALKEVSP